MTYSEPNYDDKPDTRAMLYVMGAIDELKSIGVIEVVAGDKPLTNHDERKLYRTLKKEGYKPTMGQVDAIMSRCVCADDQPEFRRVFQGIIEEGWEKIREEVALHKAEQVAPKPEDYGLPPGMILL